jgi:hypothetical protein
MCVTDPVFIYGLLNIKHAETVATSNLQSVGPFCLVFTNVYIFEGTEEFKLSPGPKTLPKNQKTTNYCSSSVNTVDTFNGKQQA